ncbi:hypothetical protein [Actinophytocola sp. KF-1]
MIDHAVEAFGPEVVRYILACDKEDLDSLSMTKERTEVLQVIRPITDGILARDGIDRQFARMSIVNYHDGYEGTIAREARKHCHGAVADFRSDDPVEDTLIRLGLDLFAAILMPMTEERFTWTFPSLPTHSHPLNEQFVKALLQDEELSKIFPGSTPSDLEGEDFVSLYTLPSNYLLWSNGNGGTNQITAAAESMIHYAFDICTIGENVSEQALIDALRETITTCRRLATGKSAPIRAAALLSNFTLSDNLSSITLSSTAIRKFSPRKKYLFMGGEGSAVLDFRVDLRLLDATAWKAETSDDQDIDAKYERTRPAIEAFQNEVRRQIDRTRFALLLASTADAILAPVLTSVSILNPLMSGRSASVDLNRLPAAPLPAQELSTDRISLIQDWARRIQNQPKSVDMGMRRLLAAVSSRMDAMDGFVDAVICWENLFGTPEGESTFRISGAMAVLLEPDSPERRIALMNEIRDLYRVRSRLVHGANEPNITTAYKHRDRAVELALAAFQAVYENEQLLQAENSSVRSRITLLGF